MIELTSVFAFFTAFFFLLYSQLRKTQQQRNESYLKKIEDNPVPWVDKFNKNFVFILAILALISMFYSTMLGEPTQSVTVNNTWVNYTVITLISNGPSAGNITTQNYPVLNSTTRFTTPVFTAGQTNVMNAYFTVIQYMLFMFSIIEVIIFMHGYIKIIERQWQRKQEGDYD